MFFCLMILWFYYLLFQKILQTPSFLFPSKYVFEIWNRKFLIIQGASIFSLLAHIVWGIVRQSSLDIQFIDWEQAGSEVQTESKVSSWRFFNFINEFNESMVKVKINAGFISIITLLLVQQFGWDNLTFFIKGAMQGNEK